MDDLDAAQTHSEILATGKFSSSTGSGLIEGRNGV
jgi:hypothetical protein